MPRDIPLNPYASRSVAEWRSVLGSAAAIEERYRAFVALTELLPPGDVLGDVASLLNSTDSELQATAANWLGRQLVRSPEFIPSTQAEPIRLALQPLLTSEDPDVQLAAVRAMCRLDAGSIALATALGVLLSRDDIQPTSQVVLADVCGVLTGQAAVTVPTLQEWLSAEQADVREATAAALLQLEAAAAPAIAELTTALDDEEPLVREYAAKALGNIGPLPSSSREALLTACDDEDEIVAAAARATLASQK
ncbi:hypothetical protein GC163_17675 [bacterium]|nr:hypothetical protein [bacterium]